MTKSLSVIASDFFALQRVVGMGTALRWLWKITIHFTECRKLGSLRPADEAMGPGPFYVRSHRGTAIIGGDYSREQRASVVFSGIREIWARDVYLGHGSLEIPENGIVVDLGANQGIFTALALSSSPKISVVAVEPSTLLNGMFKQMLAANGWTERVTLIPAFIGLETKVQQRAVRDQREYQEASYISVEEFLKRCASRDISFLKCDIEGSEFDLLRLDNPILSLTSRLAVEIHDFAGDRKEFVDSLESRGFQLLRQSPGPDCAVVLAARN